MSSLKNKIILITGASSGIGEACARLFASQGAQLILTARRVDRLKALATQLQSEYGHAHHVHGLDVSDPVAVKTFVETLPMPWQGIDVLLNNAGLALSSDPVQQGVIDNWETMIDTNVKGLLYMTRHVLPGMLKRQQGHIVNIGSIAGQEIYPNGNVYCASKHAVRALSKSIRLDLMGSPIRVSEIAPGAVETEFSLVRWQDAERAKTFYQDFTPLSAKDVADAVFYCISAPPHVNIAEITILPTDQRSANHLHRRK
ncbi:KR domain-containing protein [Legionella taurinensis]|uniref:KR domain-containing protein n=1 Tax=Legionella taurinensis TaxID=70611 RepID=A0A3A5LBZ8_9GAMM|nr:SDR family NAD(P)-dependent oxidoreductase [Legionella taurinensis]MDX1838318.1 SDR family NAD(P)-dependent oxidoreductase [Legionella taurinensis]PUT39194.1 NAD(P)-dependent oxidoreductase [Legionella taurinensis]PUT39537.1 NAD(P)-dependent oxidoreductase [Legionella taurinensis]PUT43960.1 NAD(P)-dependent oxidoreductase [Legionella taurinensis]PUT45040.1 NAD(P)-dependent oxidoreductase [Legionella taurinensis]